MQHKPDRRKANIMAEMKFSTSSSDTKEFNGKKAGKIAVIAVIAVSTDYRFVQLLLDSK